MKKYSAVEVNNKHKNNNKWKSYPKQITHNTTNNLSYSPPSNFILTQHHRGTKNAQVNQPPRQTLPTVPLKINSSYLSHNWLCFDIRWVTLLR